MWGVRGAVPPWGPSIFANLNPMKHWRCRVKHYKLGVYEKPKWNSGLIKMLCFSSPGGSKVLRLEKNEYSFSGGGIFCTKSIVDTGKQFTFLLSILSFWKLHFVKVIYLSEQEFSIWISFYQYTSSNLCKGLKVNTFSAKKQFLGILAVTA